MKLADYKDTRYPSQSFTKKAQERFFIACLSILFHWEDILF